MAKILIEGTIDIGEIEINTAMNMIKFALNTALGCKFEGIVADDDAIREKRSEDARLMAMGYSEALSKIFWNDQL